MKKIFIFTSTIFVFLLFSTSYAGDLDKQGKNEDSYLAPSKLGQISAQYFNSLSYNQSLTWQDTLTTEQKLAQMPDYKLPKRALFFSALLPGSGELYAKSYIKAGVFFLAEVASWVVYGSYTNKGHKQEDKYQNYADLNWDSTDWLNWIDAYNSSHEDTISDAHAITMIKYLGGNKSATTRQQYYEMIGKYPVFYFGWNFADQSYYNVIIDSLTGIHENSPDIGHYMDMRDKSNKFFRVARSATNYVIVNHILSAIDAAWTAKRHNKKLLEASLQFEQIFNVNHLQPVLSLRIKW